MSCYIYRIENKIDIHSIYYAGKTLIETQMHYTTIEKELLTVVYEFDKFHSCLIGTKVIVLFTTLQLSI